MSETTPALVGAIQRLAPILERAAQGQPANKASGFVPNFAPDAGINIQAVNESYKREVSELMSSGLSKGAAERSVNIDTYPALKTERNPLGVGLYSNSFGEISLADAVRKTNSKGLNPAKYAGGSVPSRFLSNNTEELNKNITQKTSILTNKTLSSESAIPSFAKKWEDQVIKHEESHLKTIRNSSMPDIAVDGRPKYLKYSAIGEGRLAVDISREKDPRETIEKMRIIQEAA
jgi:hypothetical protein